MFNPFKSLGDLAKLKDEAAKLQSSLAQENFEIVYDRGQKKIRIVMSGNQKVQTVEINGVADWELAEAFNEAIRKSHEVAARKMMEGKQWS